jgi:hypothetical protein
MWNPYVKVVRFTLESCVSGDIAVKLLSSPPVDLPENGSRFIL